MRTFSVRSYSLRTFVDIGLVIRRLVWGSCCCSSCSAEFQPRGSFALRRLLGLFSSAPGFSSIACCLLLAACRCAPPGQKTQKHHRQRQCQWQWQQSPFSCFALHSNCTYNLHHRLSSFLNERKHLQIIHFLGSKKYGSSVPQSQRKHHKFVGGK